MRVLPWFPITTNNPADASKLPDGYVGRPYLNADGSPVKVVMAPGWVSPLKLLTFQGSSNGLTIDKDTMIVGGSPSVAGDAIAITVKAVDNADEIGFGDF